jgi:methylated-DNA-[protein]-cysteine S-methyltransferase
MAMRDSVMIESPLGYLQIFADQDKVVEIDFEHVLTETLGEKAGLKTTAVTANTTLQAAIEELEAYFAGEKTDFSFNWNVTHQGTEFQQAVWQVISEIPYGQVMSYREIAETLGKPRAYRAVANACGRNPLPIIVPCHRVVGSGSNGSYTMGGYSSGVEKKQILMAIEKIEL